MKKCQKCGKLYLETEKKCSVCGILLSNNCDQPDRYRKFAELLRDYKCQKFKIFRIIVSILIVIIGVCLLFSPLVIYDKGTSISKVQNYSLMRLCFGLSRSSKLLGTGELISFTWGSITAVLGFGLLPFSCYQYDFSYWGSFLRKKFDGMNFKAMYRKRYVGGLLSLFVGSVGWIIAAPSLLLLPEAFAEATGTANSYYWKQSVDGWSVGWGGGVVLGLLILLLALGLALFMIAIGAERKYVKGKCTNEEVLSVFQGSKHPSSAVKSTSEQLRELNQLKKDGLISADDYEKKKKQILNL